MRESEKHPLSANATISTKMLIFFNIEKRIAQTHERYCACVTPGQALVP